VSHDEVNDHQAFDKLAVTNAEIMPAFVHEQINNLPWKAVDLPLKSSIRRACTVMQSNMCTHRIGAVAAVCTNF
jgi:hypothetical protein